jgi:DNA-directed RNA polymerase subunit RPC12/RpoP
VIAANVNDAKFLLPRRLDSPHGGRGRPNERSRQAECLTGDNQAAPTGLIHSWPLSVRVGQLGLEGVPTLFPGLSICSIRWSAPRKISRFEPMAHAKTSYVCLSCRASYKQPYDRTRQRACPRCAQPLIHAGSAFAAPRRRGVAAWRTLTVLLNAGVGFHKSCCGGPGYRPRTLREVRERMTYAQRSGEPIAHALVRRNVG